MIACVCFEHNDTEVLFEAGFGLVVVKDVGGWLPLGLLTFKLLLQCSGRELLVLVAVHRAVTAH